MCGAPGVCSLRSRHPRLYASVRFAHCLTPRRSLPTAHCLLITHSSAVFRFFLRIAAEMRVMIRPTGNGSMKVIATLKNGLL